MDCRKAQQLFDELSDNRLSPDVAAAVRQHLTDCTDCRVLEQRAARLQRLLSLKRHERPAPEYFDGFLAEFHQRIRVEAQQPAGWWEQVLGRVDEFLAAESRRVWRYSFTSAMGAAVLVGLMWVGLRQISEPGPAVANQNISDQHPALLAEAFLPAPHSTPRAITSQLPSITRTTLADYDPASAGSAVVPAAAQVDSPTPRYVLDRIAVTPATYDVPSVHF